MATNDLANLGSSEITVQHRCESRASRSEFDSVVIPIIPEAGVLPTTTFYGEERNQRGGENSLANLDCSSWYRARRRAASSEAVSMVFARRVGGLAKWSDKFMALGSDTTHAAAGYGAGSDLGRGSPTRICGVDRRHVSCSCDSVPGLWRSYIFYFREVSTEERASDKGRQRLSGQ